MADNYFESEAFKRKMEIAQDLQSRGETKGAEALVTRANIEETLKYRDHIQNTQRKAREVEIATLDKAREFQKTLDRRRSIAEHGQDLGGSLLKGTVALGQGAYGVLDLISDYNPVTLVDAAANYVENGEFKARNQSLDEISASFSEDGKSISQRFQDTRESIGEGQTDKLKAQRQLIEARAKTRNQENAETRSEDDSLLAKTGQVLSDFGSAVGDYVDNPTALLDASVESGVQLVSAGAIASSAGKHTANKVASKNLKNQQKKGAGNLANYNANRTTAAYLASKEGIEHTNKIRRRYGVGTAAAQEATSNSVSVQAEILSSDHNDLMVSSPEYNDLINKQKLSPEDAKRKLATKARDITAGLIGVTAGVAAKVTGVDKLIGNMFKSDSPAAKSITEGVKRSALAKTVSGGAREGVEETFQEGFGQFATNVAKQQTINPEQDLSEGVVDSAAAGFAAGAASGGAIAGVTNTGTAVKNTKENVNKAANKIKDTVVNKAESNTGFTAKVKKAIDTGDASEVLEKDAKGEAKTPLEANAYILSKPANNPTELKEKIDSAVVTLYPLMQAFKEGKLSKNEARLLHEQSSAVVELKQEYQKVSRPEVEGLITKAIDGSLERGPDTNKTVKTAIQAFNNSDFSSKAVADKVGEQANALLKSNAVSEADKADLQSIVNMAKSVNEVTLDVFNGTQGQFIGIDTYRQQVMAAKEVGDSVLISNRLDALNTFKEAHTTKLNQLKAAHKAFIDIEKRGNDTPENREKIALAEERSTLDGSNFKVHFGTPTTISAIEQEVAALNVASEELTKIANNTANLKQSEEVSAQTDPITPKKINEPVQSVSEEASTASGEALLTEPVKSKVVPKTKSKVEPKVKSKVEPVVKERATFIPSSVGLAKQAKKLENKFSVSTSKGRKEFIKERDQLYINKYNRLKDLAVKQGVPVKDSIVNKINKKRFNDISYVGSAIDNLEATLQQVKDNKELSKQFDELLKVAPGLGINVSQESIDIVDGLSPENVNKIPSIVASLKKKVEASNQKFDIRKAIFKQGRAHEEHKRGDKVIISADTNVLERYFKWDSQASKNILQDTPNAFEEFRSLLDEPSLSKEQRKAVTKIVEFHDSFRDNFFKNFSGKYNKFMHQDAINFLLKESPNLDIKNLTAEDIDPNVVSAMAISGMMWLRSKSEGTVVNNNTDINRMLGRKDQNIKPSKVERALLRDVGMYYSLAAKNDFGHTALKLLGIKAKPSTPGDVEQALENSVTNHIVNTMASMGLVKQSSKPSWLLEGLIEELPLDKLNEKVEAALKDPKLRRQETAFIKVATTKDTEYDNFVIASNSKGTGPADYLNALKQSENLFENIFNVEFEKNMPSFKKFKGTPNEVTSKITNSPQETSDKIKTKLSKAQQTANQLNPTGMVNFNYFSKDEMLTMLGYEKDYVNNRHITEQVNIEGKNNTLVNEYNNFKEFLTVMPDENAEFFFKQAVQKSNRMNPDSQLVNPQASHLHRSLVMVKSHSDKIDPTDKAQVDKLRRAIAASLGIKVETLSVSQVNKQLDQLLSQDLFKTAIKILQERPEDEESKQAVVDAVLETKEGPWALDGLTAYADYLTAKEKGAPFTVNLYREPDGITNGTAIALLQFVKNPAETIRKLRRVGIFATNTESYADYRNEGNDDAYEDIARKWGKGVDILRNFILGNDVGIQEIKYSKALTRLTKEFPPGDAGINLFNSTVDLIGKFTEEDNIAISSEGRKLSKLPLMTHNYGAGLAKIMDNFTKDRLDNIYKDITKHAIILKDTSFDKGEREVSRAILETTLGKLSKVASTTYPIDIQEVLADPINWELSNAEYKRFAANINIVYKGTLEAAFEDSYGEVLERRSMLNSALAISFEIFNEKYKKEYAALQKKNNGSLPSREQLKTLNNKLLNIMPIFKGVLTTDKKSGILAAREVSSPIGVEASVTTESAFKNKHLVTKAAFKNLMTTEEVSRSSLSLKPTVTSWEGNEVGGPVIGIHNIDAATMLTMLEQHEATNIHDAALFSVLNAEDGTKALNKAFYDINKNHSIMEEIYKTYHNALVALKKENKANNEPIFKELNKAVIKNGLAGFGDSFKAKSIYEFNVDFQKAVVDNQTQRKALFKEIKQVNQYTDGTGTEYNVEADSKALTPEEIKNYTKEVIEELKTNIDAKNNLGSDANTDFINDFAADFEVELTNKNTEAIYDALGKNDIVKDSPEHEARLKSLLDNVVTKTIKPLRFYLETKGASNQALYEVETNSVYMSNALGNKMATLGTEMSQKESYVHELMHAVTHSMIDGNSLAARQLRKFYLEVRDAKDKKGNKWFTARDLLADPKLKKTDPSYTQEIKLAKRRYDYLFGGSIGTREKTVVNVATGKTKTVELSNAHHEFLVMAVSNEALINKLNKFDAETSKVKPNKGTWMERFTAWVSALLDKFAVMSVFAKDKNASLDTKMYILAGQLAGIENRQKHNLWMNAERVSDFVGLGFDKLAEAIIAPLKAVVNSHAVATSKNKAVRLAASTAKAIPYTEQVIKALQTISDAIGLSHEGFVLSILHEIRGEDGENTYLQDLSRSAQNYIDRLRMKEMNEVSKFIRNSFLSDIDDDQNKALSNLIMTDIDSLFYAKEGQVTYDKDYLDKLYNKTGFRKQEIQDTIKEIRNTFKSPKQSRYYIKMASSMGQEMVLGVPIERVSIMNAKIIADMDGLSIKPKGDLVAAERLINKLASLVAVDSTKEHIRDTVGQVIQDEFAADPNVNGITSSLMFHRKNKERAKKLLFNNNDKLFIKGYMKERFAENRSFVVAPAGHEEALLKEGYTLESKVNKDPRDPNQQDMYMYVSRVNTFGKWLSGIVSLTGSRARGVKTTEVYSQQGELNPNIAAMVDRPVIKQRKQAELQKIADGTSTKLGTNEGTMAPLFNSQGDMVDFRYKMNEHTKKEILGKDYSLDTTFGAMESNIADKVNSRYINNELIRKTHEFFKKHAKDKPNKLSRFRGYIEVGPNAPNENYRRIYRMLPEEFKEEIRREWGGDAMYVKAEDASFIFGERELLLSNLEKKEKEDITNSVDWLKTQLNNAAAYALNRSSVKYVETIWKEVVSMAKDAIVIKSGVVLLGNKISNIILLKTMGVAVKDIAKYHAEAFAGLQNHRDDTSELAQLELQVKTDPKAKKRNALRIKELKHDIAINPVTPLIDAGMFQHIVEDVDVLRDDSYQSRIAEWLDNNKVTKKISEKTPTALKTVAKTAVMAHDTKVYKFMRDMTQASDFVARYTLHQHHLTKMQDKITPKQSIDLITKAFVNYVPPTHRYLQYANDMGLFMFTKFFLRIQGVLLYLAKMHPGGLLASIVGQGLTIDVSDIGDSWLPFGIDNRLTNPLDIAQQIITAPGTIAGIEEITR